MTPSELRRLYQIVRVQLEYGLDELLPDHQWMKAPRLIRKGLFWCKNKHPDKIHFLNIYPILEAIW